MMGTMDAITLVLTVLATARLTRLVVADRVTQRPRMTAVNWAIRRDREGLEYLLTCPWCVSVYTGAGMGAAWWAWGDARWFTAAAAALTASHVTGLLASREG